jgi:hypothetical protein
MSAKLIVGHISFPYSVTPGAVPSVDMGPGNTEMQPGSLAVNLADRILYVLDHNGSVVPLMGNDYGAVLTEHFTAYNPHGTYDTNVIIDVGDQVIDNKYDRNVIKRIGPGDATITLLDECDVGRIVSIDNVRSESGTVTLTSETGTVRFDTQAPTQSTTLVGKGQIEVIKTDSNTWEVTGLLD